MYVFVYGSLLSGESNHSILRDSELRGQFTTEDAYRMVSLGGFPAISLGGSTRIKGEIYSVSDAVFQEIEWLEGYPDFYSRIVIDTPLGGCFVYVLPPEETLEFPEIVNGNWRFPIYEQQLCEINGDAA